MILIVQIPCLNEEKTLPLVINDIPKSIPGITKIEVVVIDDGSSDKTSDVASSLGVQHIIKNKRTKGLGTSFQIGVDHALKINADILVNTDGDNQYPSSFISKLVAPIIKGEADIVIGDRQTKKVKHFSRLKKFFQWLGTYFTIVLANEPELKDAASGFRAYSRDALLNLNVTSSFSYVLDTTVQASRKKLKIQSIPILTNPPTRASRLFRSIWQHIRRSGSDILRVYTMYKPLKVFFGLGIILFFIGFIPIGRFLFDYFWGVGGSGKIQSLIIGSIILSMSFNCFALGIIGDLQSKNRTLIEYILKKLKEQDIEKH